MDSESSSKNSKLWRIWSMLYKELRLIQNDRFALLLVFILPGMIMGTLWIATSESSSGVVSGNDGEKSEDAILLGVVDNDPTDTYPWENLSENFTYYLAKSEFFIVRIFDTEEEALEALYRDEINAFAVIPYGFEGNITNDIPAFVSIHISSTDFQSQAAIFSAFTDVVYDFRYDHGWIKGEIQMVRVRQFQPTGNYTAATFGVFLLVFSVFIAVAATAAQAIVGDIPLNRMLLTPSTKMEAILSKTLAYFIVGIIQAIFLLALWMGVFNIRPNTSPVILLLILSLMSISGSALGVLISTIVTTRLQANQSFLFLLFASLIVGTGFMDVGIFDTYFPLNMGRIMIIDTAFKGIALTEFIPEILLILQVSLVFIIFAWIIFMKKTTLA